MGRLCATSMLVVICCTLVGADEQFERRRIRGTSGRAERLISLALEHSPTASGLIDRLKRTDVIVYVRLIPLRSGTATTSLMTVTAGNRYLLVTIDHDEPPATLVELLGHELQHVVEIAEAPQVRDSVGMRQLYGTIGRHSSSKNSFETMLAKVVGTRVRREFIASASGLTSPGGQ